MQQDWVIQSLQLARVLNETVVAIEKFTSQ